MSTLVLALVIVDAQACGVPDERDDANPWVNDYIDESNRDRFWEIPSPLRQLLAYGILAQTFDEYGEAQSAETDVRLVRLDGFFEGESDLPIFDFSSHIRSLVKPDTAGGRVKSTKWLSFGSNKVGSAATQAFGLLSGALAVKSVEHDKFYPEVLRYLPPTHTIFAQQHCVSPETRSKILAASGSGLLDFTIDKLVPSEEACPEVRAIQKWFQLDVSKGGEKVANQNLALDFCIMKAFGASFGV